MSQKSILEKGDVRWGQHQGIPKQIRGEFSLPSGDSAEDSVKQFLFEHAEDLSLELSEGDLACYQDVQTPIGTVMRFQERRQGVPVLGSEVVVRLDKAGRVKQINLNQCAKAPIMAPAQDAKKITAKAAVQAASKSIGEHQLRAKGEKPQEMFFPTPDGLRLAYVVTILTQDPLHDWRIVVDAYSKAILKTDDLLVRMPDGTGMVFDPNPVVTANNAALRDPNAAATCGFSGSSLAVINAQRVSRTLRDLTLSSGVHHLDGPFIRITDIAAPNVTPPAEANPNGFNYPSDDARFDAVNVYYHTDTIQRYIQSLGITTAHNSQIDADVRFGSPGTGASYSPSQDAMRFGDSGPCRPERASDGDVVLHEYGHAIQHAQVPGWGVTSPVTGRQETRAMGEGFGDILACVFFADHGGGFQREVFEDWIFGDMGGLRRVDGTKTYPASWVNQVHADGEIWSAALWNIYRSIGGDSVNPADRQAARDALLKTLILSHHATAADATMPDAAEAVMETNAALDDCLGRHLMEMLDSFHDRGILPVSSGADLYIRDALGDPGADLYGGPNFWNSPDLWIRNSDDNGTAHEPPEFGQDNWFYARVHNRGTQTARAFVVTFNVKPWAGTQFVYPGDFVPFVSAAVGFNLAAGASTVVKAKWPAAQVPAAGTHACWLASVYTPVDVSPSGRHVWEHNNLAQKNLTVVDLVPDDSIVVPFQLGSRFQFQQSLYRVEVRRPEGWPQLPVSIVHRDPAVTRRLLSSIRQVQVPSVRGRPQPRPRLRFLEPARVELSAPNLTADRVLLNLARDSSLDIGAEALQPPAETEAEFLASQADLAEGDETEGAITFRPGMISGFPIGLRPRTRINVGLRIRAPREARPGDVVEVNLVQRDRQRQVVGGITVRINIVEK